ncbi:transcriptional repressor [Tessaracoccus sp. OS52]|uniref:Fur family transcriptional regulator n=1 Tax=Tessaracoccus sp. OS52 TaxID=2886691 RepID=UPI001D10C04B|nr:Fur family transcriptional regulator [Tessaracoccus sp. OS52]MCC2594212.1 transcriptional repressor [Tessaracoccus sp. OS52]
MPSTQALSPEDATALLREAGLRVTRQRVATLQAITLRPHATVEQMVSDLSGELPKASFQAAYLVVADLVAAGLVSRLDLPGQAARYELERRDNHHHAMCIECGRLEDVACAVGEAPCLLPSDSHEMDIVVADVLYRGICRDCRRKAATTP